MRRHVRASLLAIPMLAALVAALVLVAVLQYRWISRLSRIERERLEANLAADGSRFCDDVDREVSRAWESFQVTPPNVEGELTTNILARLAGWRATAPYPRLVSRIYLVRQLPRDELELGCLNESEARFEACPMTADLASIGELFRRKGKIRRLDPLLPGLVIPVSNPRGPEEREQVDGHPPPPVRQHVIVRFDRAFLVGELLPRFAAARFGSGASVDVSVDGGGVEPFFHLGPALAVNQPRADVTARLFAIRRFSDARGAPAARSADPVRPARPEPDVSIEGPQPREDVVGASSSAPALPTRVAGTLLRAPATTSEGREQDAWLLSLRYPAGGLDAAVASARRKNLLLGSGVLLLLAAAGTLLVFSSQRARYLAEQQLGFVAGISHELRTPLTAIRSAAQNLAADVITDREQVRRYGGMIEEEGRRLTEMVARVMAFARIRSGEQLYHFRPVALAPLLQEITSGFASSLDGQGIRLELHVDDALPPVVADADALRHLFANLIDNAVKYGASGRWIGVTADRKARRGKAIVEVCVSDHGKGIRRSDRKRIFDPFFRDAEVSASKIPGSGLGLAVVRHIVEAHGGAIIVESAVARGSTFRIELPAAPASTEEKRP